MCHTQATCKKIVKSTGKGGTKISYSYEGTFVTRDGAVFFLPPPTKLKMQKPSRRIEKRMLSVLHNTKRNPRADPSVARRFVDLMCARSEPCGLGVNTVVRARNQGVSSPGSISYFFATVEHR